MGKKKGGQRGFMKSLKSTKNDDEEEGSGPGSPSTEATEVQEVTRELEQAEVKEEKVDDAVPSQVETKSQLRSRQKQEQQALKKKTAQMGKKQKAEAAALVKELKERHEQELTDFDEQGGEEGDGGEEEHPQSSEQHDSQVDSGSLKLSKAQKKREKAAKKVADREARVAEEQANMGESVKEVEERNLNSKLAPLGVRVHDVKADGHCLYRALDHQLNGSPGNAEGYKHLRQTAANYLRSNKGDFLPFFVDESGNEPELAFSAHCNNVESTAEWGGELELRALAQALRKTIVVHSMDLPDTILGADFSCKKPLRLCFMKHAYGLGDHYNSVESIET